jgi:circadian clock protein KaiC
VFALAGRDRPALYFTVVGEPPLKMLRYQQQFTFFDLARVNESVRFVNLGDDVINGSLQTMLARIVREVDAANPGLVVVDSFRTVARTAQQSHNNDLNLQDFVQQLAVG